MAEDDILMREVNDAVRHDKMMNFWNQFKMPLVYAAIALIVVTAGSSIWNHYQQSRAEEATLALDNAQQLYHAKKFTEAAKAFEGISQQTRGDLADMAKLWRARALLGADKHKSALRVLQNIVLAPEGHDLFWRDLACLHIAGLTKTASEVPEACSGTKPSPLSPLLVQLNAAGKWSAGDTEGASALLGGLAQDTTLSADVRARASAWENTIRAHDAKE